MEIWEESLLDRLIGSKRADVSRRWSRFNWEWDPVSKDSHDAHRLSQRVSEEVGISIQISTKPTFSFLYLSFI
jgi:hypothetical protein